MAQLIVWLLVQSAWSSEVEFEAAWAAGAVARARWIAEQATQTTPSDPQGWVWLARTHTVREAALAALDRAVTLVPTHAPAVVAWAERAVGSSEAQRAEEALVSLHDEVGWTPEAWVALARLQGSPEPLRKALAAAPGHPGAAVLLARLGDDEAEISAALAAVRPPTAEVAWLRLGRALTAGEPPDERVAEMMAVVPHHRTTEWLARWARCVTERRATAEVFVRAWAAHRAPPSFSGGPRFTAAEAPRCAAAHALQAQLDRTPARVDALHRAITLAPDDAGLQRELGEALQRLGRTAEAIAPLQKAAAAQPWVPPLSLARALHETGDRAAAWEVLQQAARAHPHNVEIVLAQGELAPQRAAAETAIREASTRLSDPRLSAWLEALAEPAPVAAAAPLPELEEGIEEVVVEADALRASLKRIRNHMASLGYAAPVRKSNGDIVFTGRGVQRPQLTLHADGQFSLQKSGMVQVPARPGDPRSGWVWRVVSARKMKAARAEVLNSVTKDLRTWREAVSAEEFTKRLQVELPARLDRVWFDGVAFDGGALPTLAERRAALLTFWATRTCGTEGYEVRLLVQRFLTEVVQTSPAPITPADLAQANEQDLCEEPLTMVQLVPSASSESP